MCGRRLALAALVIASVLGPARAQMSMSPEEEELLEEMGVKGTPMGRKDQTPKSEVVKSDLPYIRCDVCRRMTEMAYEHAKQVLDKRFKYKAKRKNEIVNFDGEAEVADYIEKLCAPDKAGSPGEWIKSIDLVADGDRLVLHNTGLPGHCDRECRTIERACEDIVDAADTDFSEVLYEAVKDGTDLEKVQRLVCNRSAKVCKAKPPKLEPNRIDYPFREMTPDEKQMADMCAQPRACSSSRARRAGTRVWQWRRHLTERVRPRCSSSRPTAGWPT
jgi:hypothetical protein